MTQQPFVKIEVIRVRGEQDADLPLPEYMSDHASGMDLRAAVEKEEELPPGERRLIPTGLAVAIPPGFEAQIRPRSGLALRHGISLLNTPGTIDADYRGEIKIILINLGSEPFVVRRGDRIAQMVFAPVQQVSLVLTDQLEDTARNAGGFGHTGT